MLLHVSQQSQLPLCYESFPQCLSATVGGDNARRQGNSLVPSPIRRPKEVSEKRSPTGNYLPFSHTGMSPSTLEGPDKGRERRLAAKVRAAATEGGSARCPLCRGSGMGLASGKQSDKLSGLGSSAGPQGQARQADSGARAQVLDTFWCIAFPCGSQAACCQPRVLSSCGSSRMSGRGTSPWSRSCQDGVQSQRRTASRRQFEVAAPPATRMLCLSPGQVEGREGGRASAGLGGCRPKRPKRPLAHDGPHWTRAATCPGNPSAASANRSESRHLNTAAS